MFAEHGTAKEARKNIFVTGKKWQILGEYHICIIYWIDACESKWATAAMVVETKNNCYLFSHNRHSQHKSRQKNGSGSKIWCITWTLQNDFVCSPFFGAFVHWKRHTGWKHMPFKWNQHIFLFVASSLLLLLLVYFNCFFLLVRERAYVTISILRSTLSYSPSIEHYTCINIHSIFLHDRVNPFNSAF